MRYLLLLFSITLTIQINCQSVDEIKDESIGTVEFSRKGYPLSMPVIGLFESEYLELKFDVFGANEEAFIYDVELCDYDWSKVDLNTMEYIEGYTENTLTYFGHAINTTVDYVQYRLTLPNNDMSFLLAGNYLLKIYREENREVPILLKKFVVYDEKVIVDIKEDKFQSEILMDRQELNISIKPGRVSFNDLAGNIRLTVMQNNDWNTVKTFEKYTTNGNGEIVFNSPGQIVFPGMNEFRIFDTKSLKFLSERVDYIDYKAPYMHAYLKPDKLRGDRGYFYNEDLNGLYYIENQESHDDDLMDADYVMVHFILKSGMPLPADVYIEGALCDWKHEDNYLEFKPEDGAYEKVLLLKQGLYNYRYGLLEYNTKYIGYDITEGSHQQTTNNYTAILYYRPLGELYFCPTGIGVITTDQK